ncbi:MAG: hypothetical protein JF625_10165 [Inquilinus limosus]|uniref:Uncharacterized protein n=1 Tax=Inquilinus limosus TaxID=171674 RepID=A0A952FLR0_9PROT|nr:hypothetical protein [Inquilinus limosus]
MTLDQIIAAIASIGTLGSALATWRTISQISKQRQSSYHPELAFGRRFFKVSRKGSSKTGAPDTWRAQKGTDNSVISTTDEVEIGTRFSIPLTNIGLGAAKSVIVKWSFDVDNAISLVNQAMSKKPHLGNYVYENGVVKSVSEGLAIFDVVNRIIKIDYILSNKGLSETDEISVPLAYLHLLSRYIHYNFEAHFSKETKETKETKEIKIIKFDDFPKLNSSVSYLDIGEKKFKMYYEFEFSIQSYYYGTANFSGSVGCKRIKKLPIFINSSWSSKFFLNPINHGWNLMNLAVQKIQKLAKWFDWRNQHRRS